MKSSLNAKLKRAILQETGGRLADYTPSLVVEVYHRGRRKARLAMGEKYRLYDLASLTKPIFTVSMIMQLVDEGRVRINDPIQKHLKWWPHRKTKIRDVLSHSGGLTWWAPFYEMIGHKIRGDKVTPKKDPAAARELVRRWISKHKLGSGKKAVYSDLDFLLLGFLIEEVTGLSLRENWQKLNRRLKLKSLHFAVDNRPPFPRAWYAPTEKCPWRRKVLRGEVHDDNTWALGGVSSHAGLFGRSQDVAKWGLLLRQAYFSRKGSALASHKTARLFMRRAIPRNVGDWALGLMMPSRTGSTAGKYFSAKSVGHTGFTGTSIWFDPVKDLLVVILSNRVHPTRDNLKFRFLRPRIHDFVVENLG